MKPLKLSDIKNSYLDNKNCLSKFKSYRDYFAIPNGKYKICYNKSNLKFIKKLKSKKIFSSNNFVTNNLNNLEIDRVSIEDLDVNIFFIYFKIFKSRLINKFSR